MIRSVYSVIVAAVLTLIFVMALVWPLAAGAQLINLCTGAAASAPANTFALSASQPLTCASPTQRTYRRNLAGVTAWRWCKVPDGSQLQFGAMSWSYAGKTPQLAADLWDAGTGASDETVATMFARHAITDIRSAELTPVWCPHWDAMQASRPLPPLPPAAWVTASTVGYRLVAGALQAGGGAVKTGLACDCSAPFFLITRNYCPFTGAAPGVVTYCKKP